MKHITAGARSRFGYLFGSIAAQPVPAAKAKARPAQSCATSTKPTNGKPVVPRPAAFGHLLKASRARDVEMPAAIATALKPRTLGERHRTLLRARGETVPEPVDALPEQPIQRRNVTSTLGERVAALHEKIGRI